MRRPGERISPSQRMRYCAAIREAWTRDPTLWVEQVRELTKAPHGLVREVRLRMVKEGKLKAGPRPVKDALSDAAGGPL